MVKLFLQLGLLILLQAAPLLYAEDSPIYLDVSPKSGALDDLFQLLVTIEGGVSAVPVLVGGNDFDVTLIGPRQQTAIINGEVRQSISFVWSLTPKKEGNLTSPGVEVQLGDKLYTVPGKVISIKKGKKLETANKDLWLRQFNAKERVFVGEQLTNTLNIYHRVNVLDPQLTAVNFDGFWVESLGEEKQFSSMAQGLRYHVTEIRKALFPLRAGKIKIQPIELKAKLRYYKAPTRSPIWDFDPFSDDIFAGFFGKSEIKPVVVHSNPLELEVRPLPPFPGDLQSWGLSSPPVGQTMVNLIADERTIATGESKSFTVEISTTGNINPLKEIPVPLPKTLKLYKETAAEKKFESGDKLITKKTFRFTLVPLLPGEVTIPPLKLHYFDPKDEQYKLAETKAFAFKATGEALIKAPQPLPQQPDLPKADGTEPAPSPDGALPELSYEEPGLFSTLVRKLAPSTLLLALAAIAILLAPIVLIRNWKREKLPLVAAREGIRASANWEQLAGAFLSYLELKLPQAHGRRGPEQLKAVVREQILDPNLAFSLLAIIEEFDTLGRKEKDAADIGNLKARILQIAEEW